MSQDLKDLQTGPVLTLDPFLGEKKRRVTAGEAGRECNG